MSEESKNEAEKNKNEDSKTKEQTIVDDWVTEEDDRKNWESWLVSQPRIEKIIQIRHAVTKLWQNCEESYPPLPYYTPHGPAHAKSVEDILHRLLPGNSYKKLKEIERYYLLASAWTHDVGMIRGLHEKEDAKLHPAQIRETHHTRSENYIVNNYLMLDIEQKDAQALGLLAFFHRKREAIEKCPDTFVVGTETVRLRLLAAYLRLADGLDVDQSRAPSSDYAICLAYNIPFTSKLHWIKSRLVSGIAILPKQQRILVNFKQPHEQDLKNFCSKQNGTEQDSDNTKSSEAEYDIELLKQNLVRLQQTVMNGLREELDSVKTTLIRGGITCYLDLAFSSTEMVIDDQVFPEIIRLADDLDMIVHPSATRLILLLLDTVNHIIDSNLNPMNKSGGCQADECSSKKCTNSNVCQMPKQIKKEIKEFLAEIKEQVIEKRKCHIGLQSLVSKLDDYVENRDVKIIKKIVKFWKGEIERERRQIRRKSYEYFKKTIDIDKKKEPLKKEVKSYINKGDLFKIDCGTSVNPCINILLYGYSELVIKSLSGFRDAVIGMVIEELNDRFNSESCLVNYFHKLNIEEIASSIFRIFVCEGQPKTITAPNDTLQYHDGTRFAIALGRRGFKNVVIIPDLVAGNLLQNSSHCSSCKIHFVILGVNGVKLIENQKAEIREEENVFLHSSGHIAIANLVCKKQENTRLVLVSSMSKCKLYKKEEEKDKKEEEKDKFNGIEKRQGYLFWNRCGEKTRKEAFFARDMQVQQELLNYKISLYNPREDKVSLSLINDVISDVDCICDVNSKENAEKIIKHIEEYKSRIDIEEKKIIDDEEKSANTTSTEGTKTDD